MTTAPRRRNQRGQGALLREEILDAAVRIIDRSHSEVEVSLRSIAREAGVTTMALYGHFADRDDLLAAVAVRGWEQVCAEIIAQVKLGDDPRSRVMLGCQAYVAFAQRFPLRYTIMTQVEEAPPAARKSLDVMTRGLLECGRIDPAVPPGVDTGKTAAALSVALHGVAMLHRTDTPHLWLHDFATCEVIGSLVDAAVLQIEQAAVMAAEAGS